MRFLKNRIAEARAFQARQQQKTIDFDLDDEDDQEFREQDFFSISTQDSTEKNLKKNTKVNKRRRPSGSCFVPKTSRETKNLVKNYGKAICNFSTSTLAKSYLDTFAKQEGVTSEGFLKFAENAKNKIDGLHHFREILLSSPKDNELTAAYRKIYRQISEVFIKFFSVNWIFHSKVKYKMAHLNFRFKMLRRIRYPELFTYLKGPRGTLYEDK